MHAGLTLLKLRLSTKVKTKTVGVGGGWASAWVGVDCQSGLRLAAACVG